MSKFELFANLFSIFFAWPLVALIALAVFWRSIAKVLNRITLLQAGGITLHAPHGIGGGGQATAEITGVAQADPTAARDAGGSTEGVNNEEALEELQDRPERRNATSRDDLNRSSRSLLDVVKMDVSKMPAILVFSKQVAEIAERASLPHRETLAKVLRGAA